MPSRTPAMEDSLLGRRERPRPGGKTYHDEQAFELARDECLFFQAWWAEASRVCPGRVAGV
ncbi:MAG: hypothetical protein GY944_13405 [bacterium]|nr:hypothetical protein [bacterium]